MLARKTRRQTGRLAEALLVQVGQSLGRVAIFGACQLCFVHTAAGVTERTRPGELCAGVGFAPSAGALQTLHRGVDHVLLERRHETGDVLLELLRPKRCRLLCRLRRPGKLLGTYTVSHGLLRNVEPLLLNRTEPGDARAAVGLVRQRRHLLGGHHVPLQRILDKRVERLLRRNR